MEQIRNSALSITIRHKYLQAFVSGKSHRLFATVRSLFQILKKSVLFFSEKKMCANLTIKTLYRLIVSAECGRRKNLMEKRVGKEIVTRQALRRIIDENLID